MFWSKLNVMVWPTGFPLQISQTRETTLLSSCPVAALRLCITPVIFSTFPFQWRDHRVNIIVGVKSGTQKTSLTYQQLDGTSGAHQGFHTLIRPQTLRSTAHSHSTSVSVCAFSGTGQEWVPEGCSRNKGGKSLFTITLSNVIPSQNVLCAS